MEIKKLSRKPFSVDAVQVTDANMEEVAEWCNGEIRSNEDGRYIKVKVRYPLNDRQTQAFASDWVLVSRRGYKVYTDSAIGHSFEDFEEATARSNARTVDNLRVHDIPLNVNDDRNVFEEMSGTDSFTIVKDSDQISGKRS